jgi:hypothetical protein
MAVTAVRTARLRTAFTRERSITKAKKLAAEGRIPPMSVDRYFATVREDALRVGDEEGGRTYRRASSPHQEGGGGREAQRRDRSSDVGSTRPARV